MTPREEALRLANAAMRRVHDIDDAVRAVAAELVRRPRLPVHIPHTTISTSALAARARSRKRTPWPRPTTTGSIPRTKRGGALCLCLWLYHTGYQEGFKKGKSEGLWITRLRAETEASDNP